MCFNSTNHKVVVCMHERCWDIPINLCIHTMLCTPSSTPRNVCRLKHHLLADIMYSLVHYEISCAVFRCYCRVLVVYLYVSEFSGCEGSALGLLLRGHLWEDAVAFLENQAINSSYKYSSLFQSLLATMAQVGPFMICQITTLLTSGRCGALLH